jgi:hypothetical protein
LDISDFPTRHPYGLALVQNHIERILAGWVDELAVPFYRARDVTGFAQHDAGVDVVLSDGTSLRAQYLAGCDGGRSLVRKAAGIEFPGWDPTTSFLIAEVRLAEEPPWGLHHDAIGRHAFGKLEDGLVRVLVTEKHLPTSAATLRDLSEALIAVWGTDYGVHSPIWISRFTDMARQAAAYRKRWVLLAGDAAHVHNPLAQVALFRQDDHTKALGEIISELLGMDEPRTRFAAMMSGLDVHYDLGEGHPLLGRRMPDLDLVTANGPLRIFTLLHDAQPVLLNLGKPGGFDITPWAARVQLIDAKYVGTWELPALGAVTAPTAVLIRPDGYVAWVGDLTQLGLADALTSWFGPPTAA